MSNPPSKRRYPEFATSVVNSLVSPARPLLTELQAGQPMFSFISLIGVQLMAPRLFVTQSQPVEVRPSWMRYLIRRRLVLLLRQLFFATCFLRVAAPQPAIPRYTSPVETTRPRDEKTKKQTPKTKKQETRHKHQRPKDKNYETSTKRQAPKRRVPVGGYSCFSSTTRLSSPTLR